MIKLRKFMGVVLCISILSSILCFNVSAIKGYNLTFDLSKDKKSYICTGIDDKSVTSVTIPSEHEGLPVSSIGKCAFKGCTALEDIDMPKVTSIGDSAFYGCRALEQINMPNVTSIGDYAFIFCRKLEDINMPKVTSIGYDVFFGCRALEDINMPKVTSIGDSAFSSCFLLKDINMPNVTSIGYAVFLGCRALEQINMPNVTSIGDCAFQGCTALEDIDMPKVTSIGNGAFNSCEALTEITIPNSVTSIGNSVFQDCTKLKKITIPHGVTSIGYFTFDNCTALTEITIPNSVTSIGDYAFANCTKLKKITIPHGVTSIGDYVFLDCESLKEITLPKSVNSIGEEVFLNCCSLTNICYTGTQDEWNKIYLDEDTKAFLNSKNIIFSCNVPTITEVTGNPTEWINNVTLTVSGIDNPEENLNATPYSFSTIKSVYNWQAENTATFDHNQTVYIYMRDNVGNIALCDTQVIDKIDNTAPTFTDVSRNPKDWSNGNVTLTINGANDNQLGLSDKPYSFSYEKSSYNWQAENTTTITKSGTVYIYVRDKAGNITYCGSQTIEVTSSSQPSNNKPHVTNPKTSDDVTPKSSNSFKPLVKRSYNTMPNAINQNISDNVMLESSNPDTTTKPTTTKPTNSKPKESNPKARNNRKIAGIVILVVGGVVAVVLIVRRKKIR